MTKNDKCWYDLQNSLTYGLILTTNLRIDFNQRWLGVAFSILFALNAIWTIYLIIKWVVGIDR